MAFDAENIGRELGESVKRHSTAIVVGSLIGLASGGIWGLFFGGLIGFWISRGLKRAVQKYNPQESFFRATFAVMGKLAKADGRVTEDEIAFARGVMDQMRLDEERRRSAIELFNRGKEDDFDIAEVLRPLAAFLRYRPNVRVIFVEIQLQAAMADGSVSENELKIIQQVCLQLQMTQQEIMALVARMQAQQSFHHQGGFGSAESAAMLLKDAYGTLGVSEDASDAEVKKAYRRLMSQHHPDKLVSKGLPEDMIELAKEKAQEIQAAYERIKTARKVS
ncbi:co-chaperone DjlA [Marinobacterium jannaschii]|uniref:co-chaperone DjlA n=1 Tax=Marinobacterium jannaschii TaxID=64970 RepID=UPI000484FC40|nr:co-chaperone DjlA [Marinobacterium jannaschii]